MFLLFITFFLSVYLKRHDDFVVGILKVFRRLSRSVANAVAPSFHLLEVFVAIYTAALVVTRRTAPIIF